MAIDTPARADVIWDFSYSATVTYQSDPAYSLGQEIHASGQITTEDIGGNITVVGISGTYDGATIDALIAPGGYSFNDNLLFPTGPKYLDDNGLSFMAGGSPINLYYGVTGKYDEAVDYAFGDVGYEVTDNGSFTISPAQAAVPEPASLALLGTALAGLGLTRRRKRS